MAGGAVSIQIGYVGLSGMGGTMARNLAKYRATHVHNSPPVLVWNRSSAKGQKLLAELGADKIRVTESLDQVATECDIIFTSLTNDEAVKSVYQQFVATLKNAPPQRKKIFVESSTTFPTLAGELETLISSAPHCRLITCPVFGTPPVAEAAQLIIVMSGDHQSKQEVAPILVPAVGRKVIDLGESLEKAPTFKLIGNSMILGILEILTESYTLAEKAGIAASDVHGFVQDMFPAPGMIRYSERISQDNFDGSAGFSVDGGIKDAHIRRLTAIHNSPMPCIDIAHQHLITARAIHRSKVQLGKETVEVLDWSSLVTGARAAAGLDVFASARDA
ncbi:NAD(P)-binding protein [Mycena venus]|uniref:NAD(P)-binding protein n=1 Tax=Mycena venus TaxID=2733690 RepID=A0A8H6XMW5_9AGAR|nr:NAD(P)-binding protein [Mycena venus]